MSKTIAFVDHVSDSQRSVNSLSIEDDVLSIIRTRATANMAKYPLAYKISQDFYEDCVISNDNLLNLANELDSMLVQKEVLDVWVAILAYACRSTYSFGLIMVCWAD